MDTTITGTKWIFRNNLDENGVVSRNKARIVAQGYNQQEGIDYDETYAPVARLESIRILLAYACAIDFKLFQMDVKSAFLNGFINEEIVMENPNHPNEPNEAIPEVNPVLPEPNHIVDAHDPNEMVDIPDDEELVDYNEDDEEEPEEEPKEEPKPNNGHGN
ncbi:copia protein [Tanacetum coccineum]